MCHFIPSPLSVALCEACHVHIHYSYVKWDCMPPQNRPFSGCQIQSGKLYCLQISVTPVIPPKLIIHPLLTSDPLPFLSTSHKWNPTHLLQIILVSSPGESDVLPFPCPVIRGSKHSREWATPHSSVQVWPKQSCSEKRMYRKDAHRRVWAQETSLCITLV